MLHSSIRAFGRSYTLQHVDMWAGRDLGLFWSYREPSGAVRYHCGAWVLWVRGLKVPPVRVPDEDADAAPHARVYSPGPRIELECGRFALSF